MGRGRLLGDVVISEILPADCNREPSFAYDVPDRLILTDA